MYSFSTRVLNNTAATCCNNQRRLDQITNGTTGSQIEIGTGTKIGKTATATGSSSIAIGDNAKANYNNSTAIGVSANTNGIGEICLGGTYVQLPSINTTPSTASLGGLYANSQTNLLYFHNGVEWGIIGGITGNGILNVVAENNLTGGGSADSITIGLDKTVNDLTNINFEDEIIKIGKNSSSSTAKTISIGSSADAPVSYTHLTLPTLYSV